MSQSQPKKGGKEEERKRPNGNKVRKSLMHVQKRRKGIQSQGQNEVKKTKNMLQTTKIRFNQLTINNP